jgi:tetratricopeptide (TPR) repeat protein
VLLAQGKLEETMDAYQQSLKFRQIPAEQDASNSGLQRDLKVSYERIGDVLVAQGKLQKALESYQQSLTIGRTLADRYKSYAGAQRDLIVALFKVATTMAKIGGNDDRVRAQTMLQEALNLTDKYEGNDRQQFINLLNQALQKLVQ